MVVVSIFAVVFLLLAAPFGVALWRHLTGRMPPLPEEYARYRPDRYPR
ncbi:hypothetical protein ACFVS9_28055 [Streptomyces sp. NPDC058008]